MMTTGRVEFRSTEGTREARGRNGWFEPTAAEVTTVSATAQGPAAEVVVGIRSRAIYRNVPPIYLRLPLEDAKALVGAMQESIDELSRS